MTAASRNAPAWLKSRPIAHRGLHDLQKGIVENSLAAARAAIAKDYAIECDVRLSRDGEAIVFHDETLKRLIGIDGELGRCDATELITLAYQDSHEKIATLDTLLATVAGRVPLIVELKSHFNGDPRLSACVAALAARYGGPLALKSFDPQMLCQLRGFGATQPLGLVAMAHYAAGDWPKLDAAARKSLEALTDFPRAKPDFLSWHVGDLPHATPLLCRELGLPVLTWTVRSEAERSLALQWADQIIFEGFAA
ncbi:MAG: glycerophosphodiester phosphodiesterase family protein [Methylovirgula sp.]